MASGVEKTKLQLLLSKFGQYVKQWNEKKALIVDYRCGYGKNDGTCCFSSSKKLFQDHERFIGGGVGKGSVTK